MNPSEYEEMLTHLSTDELAQMLNFRQEVRARRRAGRWDSTKTPAYDFSIKAIEAELERRQTRLEV